eukprot:1788594-Amphidinium_carterae.1
MSASICCDASKLLQHDQPPHPVTSLFYQDCAIKCETTSCCNDEMQYQHYFLEEVFHCNPQTKNIQRKWCTFSIKRYKDAAI